MQTENNQQTETVVAFCECCSNNATAARETLIADGWFLGKREQFCPECND